MNIHVDSEVLLLSMIIRKWRAIIFHKVNEQYANDA